MTDQAHQHISARLLIDGILEPGDATTPVINPATGDVFAEAPRASAAQLNRAVAGAKRAFLAWSTTPVAERQRALAAIADAIEHQASTLARILTLEQGKPLGEAIGEILTATAIFRYFSAQELPLELAEDGKTRRVEIHRRPLGVVAAIVPWNYPVTLLAFKLPAALLAGNTVVVKPAPTTPLTTLLIGELVAQLVPPGVVNVIADDGSLGAQLASHPDVRKVSFTGSTETGQQVMGGAAKDLKRITLELGGNDPAIVLADADPIATARQIFGIAFTNAGQVCIAIKRVYVHASLYEAFCAELARLADAAQLGDGLEQGTTMGPLQNRRQYDHVLDLIGSSRADGRIIAGGEALPGPGFFIRPTIIRDVSNGNRIVDEEQFGPVLPVIRFDDEAAAIAMANASKYGLGASVWSADAERARFLADGLFAGNIWINQHADLAPNIPFAGAGASGIGSELGIEGLREFTQLQVVNVARAKEPE